MKNVFILGKAILLREGVASLDSPFTEVRSFGKEEQLKINMMNDDMLQ